MVMGMGLPCADTLLVPLSLFLTLGYHAYLWHTSKINPSRTSIGIDTLRRKLWFQAMKEGDDKKEMLAVQSMRNTLMVAILAATISALVNASLAALTNNALNASHLFRHQVFGLQNPRAIVMKYGSAALLLSASFLFSSLAIGMLVDANFLINARGADAGERGFLDGAAAWPVTAEYVMVTLERGFMLAIMGNRVLCMSFPLLLWMLGPWPVVLSSLLLVWVLHGIDFAPKCKTFHQED